MLEFQCINGEITLLYVTLFVLRLVMKRSLTSLVDLETQNYISRGLLRGLGRSMPDGVADQQQELINKRHERGEEV